MTVKNFEELKVWQQAKQIASLIYEYTGQKTFERDRMLVDQMRRAAVSIMANIAEGFERGSNKEFVQFLFIAKGSSGELRSHLILSHERGYVTTAQYEKAREMAAGQSAMLNHFIRYLQSTDMKRKRCGSSETFKTSTTS